MSLLLPFYRIAWHAALPVLRLSSRIREGWDARVLKQVTSGPFQLWIQSASGGEAMIAKTILAELDRQLSSDHPIRVLATSGTSQGLSTLASGLPASPGGGSLEVTVARFPFDAPHLMDRALELFSPELVALVETELWPALLHGAAVRKIPVLLVNGRLSPRSVRAYRPLRGFFRTYGPSRVLAVSAEDQERFAQLVGRQRTALMPNIKFDRLALPAEPGPAPRIPACIPSRTPFLVLGSIRRQEEKSVLKTVLALLGSRPELTIGLFPKHQERAAGWLRQLERHRVRAVRRSLVFEPPPPGTVIVWDRFGELPAAYTRAETAFVGGSLANLGGQNFLEPLAVGLRPVIGPYWQNFAWVGSAILETGLVRQIDKAAELAPALLEELQRPADRAEIARQARSYFQRQQGGARQAAAAIIDQLSVLRNIP